MKKSKIIVGIIVFIVAIATSVRASNINLNNIDINSIDTEAIKEYVENTDTESMDSDLAELITMYDELTKEYSNEEIADMIEDNAAEIKKDTGIDVSTIKQGTDMLRSLDTERTKKVLNDIDVNEVKKMVEEGYSDDQIAESIISKIDPVDKLILSLQLIWALQMVRDIVLLTMVVFIYKIVVRWFMYRKAGKHGWASIVPIYNQIVYLQTAGLSGWLYLLVFIPVFGWIAYGIVKIVSKFTLAKQFEKGVGYGFGLWFLEIIFESIIAFSSNIKYKTNNKQDKEHADVIVEK